MNGRSKMVLAVVMSVAIVVCGLGLALNSPAVGLFMAAIGAVHFLYRYPQLVRFRTMTFEAYRRDHPENARGGRVSCFHCGGKRVQVRGLLNHTYHREHLCVQCGETL